MLRPSYETAPYLPYFAFRPWNRLDMSRFQDFITDSIICQPKDWSKFDPSELAKCFDDTINDVLDQLIPYKTAKLRRRTSDPWYDAE